MIADLATATAIAFALVATRMAGFVVVSPFPGPSTPAIAKIGLVLLLALAVAPLGIPARVPAFGPPLFVAATGDLLVGLSIGFVFRIGMSAAEVLGSSWSHALGLTFAASYDPTQGAQSDALTRIVTSGAALLALGMGAHRVVLGALLGSLAVVPIGGAVDLEAYGTGILAWTARSLECGLGLAVPAMTVAVVVQIALGMIARAAPALQVFSVGITVTLASGVIVLLAGLAPAFAGLGAHLEGLAAAIDSAVQPR